MARPAMHPEIGNCNINKDLSGIPSFNQIYCEIFEIPLYYIYLVKLFLKFDNLLNPLD